MTAIAAGQLRSARRSLAGAARTLPALAALLLAGCAGLTAAPRSPISDEAAAIQGLETVYAPEQVVRCIRTPLDSQTDCRDEIVQALLIAIDLRYADFELSFFDNNRYGNFGATLVTLGLTGAASLSGAHAAQILAGIASGVTGGREAFNREILADRTAVALQTAMRAQRNTVLAQIRLGLRQPARAYPLGAALADVYAYFRAGSVVGALTGVSEAVANEAQVARERLGRVSTVAVTPSALDLFRQFQSPNAAERQGFIRRAQAAMRRLGIGGDVMDVMLTPEREADRQALARALARE